MSAAPVTDDNKNNKHDEAAAAAAAASSSDAEQSQPADATEADGEEETLSDKLLALHIKTPLPIEPLSLAALSHELVGDVIKQIFEIQSVCYLSSFALSFQGRVLNDWEELSSIPGLVSGSVLDWVETPYDPRSVRTHLRRLRSILAGPVPYDVANSVTVFNDVARSDPPLHVDELLASESAKKEEAAAPVAAKKDQPKRGASGSGRGGKGKAKSSGRSEPVGESKSHAATTAAAATSTQLVVDASTQEIKKVGVRAQLVELFPATKASKTPECLREITISGWNPVPGWRVLRGDLLYLQAKTCEGQIYHITAATTGFYINNSTLTEFHPEPASNAHHCHHLVGLLSAVSSTFKNTFPLVLNMHFERDPLEVLHAPFPPHAWAAPARNYSYSLNRAEDALALSIEGNTLDLKSQLRDWNFDFQLLRDHGISSVMDRLIRDCSLFKFNCDFVEDATRGVIDIVSGSVPPLNPLDPRPAQMFLYNNIFFSFCMDARELYAQAGGDMTAHKMANNDINGLRLFSATNVKDLHPVPTALIDYKGWRMIAQGVIPGILNSEQPSNIVYGSALPTDPLVAAEPCSALMQQVAKALYIKEHSLVDQHGSTLRFSTSASTKGIVGTDGRTYVLDFFRMTPRDANFVGSEHIAKLLRFEFVRMFRRVKIEEFLQQERSKAASSSDGAAAASSSSVTPPDFTFNVDCFTDLKLAGELSDIGADEAFVREASEFLTDKVIPSLFVEWRQFVNLPIDGAELCEYLHAMGINLRYLGRIASLSDASHPIYALIVQEMIARAAKHLFNKTLREHVDIADTAHATAFFLNLLCGRHAKDTAIHPSTKRGGCSYDYASLWAAIRQHVDGHFRFKLPASVADVRTGNPLALLRRFCLQTGVQVRARNYDLTTPFPFCVDDVLDMRPRVKHIQPQNEDGTQLLALGKKCFGTDRLDHAYDLINEALRIFHQVYGILHPDCAAAYSLLAKLLFAHGNFAAASKTQRKALLIYERVLGVDDPETIRAYLQLGLYSGQTDPAEGLRYLHRARYLGELIAGERYPDRTTTLTNIAVLLQERGQLAASVKYLLEVLDCNLKTIGRNDHRTAATFHAVAMAYSGIQNFRKALEYEKSSYQIFLQTLGESHPSTVQSATNLKQLAKSGIEATAAKAAKLASIKAHSGPRPNLAQQLSKSRKDAARLASELPNARKEAKAR